MTTRAEPVPGRFRGVLSVAPTPFPRDGSHGSGEPRRLSRPLRRPGRDRTVLGATEDGGGGPARVLTLLDHAEGRRP